MRLIDGDDLYRKVVGYNGGAVDKTVAKRLIEQQPTVQRNSTQSNASNTLNALDTTLNALDTIYRQAAIDALGEEPMVWCNENEYELGERNQWNSDVLAIKAVPSAQPERLTDDDFETIRIHLSAQKERLCNQSRWKEAEEYQRIIDRFMSFASAQPDIIRCKDCKHYLYPHGCGHLDGMTTAQEDGFCSYAERRTDEND